MGVKKRSWDRSKEERLTGMSLEVMAEQANAGSEIHGNGFGAVTDHELLQWGRGISI